METGKRQAISRQHIMEIDGRPFEASIFSGNGKMYDELRCENPLLPRRMGTFLLRPMCPIIETIVEHRKNVAIIEQPVAISVPSPSVEQELSSLALALA